MRNSTKWLLALFGFLFVGGAGFMLLLVVLLVRDPDGDEVTGAGEKIGLIELRGVIVSSEETVRQFKKYRNDRSVKGILFRVDSPGGGVVASQEIYREVRATRLSGKPVVVSMGALAASGGFYVACGASRIVANPGTLTGSIGVISQFLEYDTLLHKIGVGVTTIKSGKLKDAGSPFRTMTPEDRRYFQDLMDGVHRQFIDVVRQERHIAADSLALLADGRVFTGEQALAAGLVDTLGSEEEAIGIAARLAGIPGEPSIVRERKRRAALLDYLFGEAKIPDLFGMRQALLEEPLLQYRLPL